MLKRVSLGYLCVLVACGGGSGDDDGTGSDAMVIAPDATTPDAGPPPDAAPPPDATPPMSIHAILPEAASRQVDTSLTVYGFNIADGAQLTLENCDTATVYDLSSSVAVASDGRSLTALLAMDPAREQGVYTVEVTNPDAQSDRLQCAFRVLDAPPPTVTDVIPATAYRGMAGDGVNSDGTVTILGTGFQSTPHVRWVKTDGTVTYDALFVGFVSSTELSAVVPSETLGMAPGEYHVLVTNPDLLSASWLVHDGMGGQTEGIFTITDVAPPDILDITPSRIENGSCTSTIMTVTGAGFAAGATMWYVAAPGAACAGSTTDANGDTLCPVVVDGVDPAGTSLTAHFDPCPQTGPYPMVVMNPDGQLDYYFSVEITPSSDGHLNTGAFEVLDAVMQTPRWRHAAEYGFDAFGSAHLYAAGGQDASGAVLGTVEVSQLNVFGRPGPFRVAMQYGSAAEPRVANELAIPRQGGALVRVGRDLYSLGGAEAATDVASTVVASAAVERARILSYAEMPAIKLPNAVGGAGLPEGTWYYRVSALGPWGESLGTREVVAINVGGQIEVCWDAPNEPGATAYNVYRSLAADGRAGTTALLAVEQAGPCFVDDGADERTPAPGHLRGVVAAGTGLAEGTQSYRVSAVVSSGETLAGYPIDVAVSAADVTAGNAAVQLAWDEIAGASYHVYKWDAAAEGYRLLDTGGPVAVTTYTDDGAAFDAAGQAPRSQTRPLPPGSLSLWDGATVPSMNAAREGVDAVVIHMDPDTSAGMVARILAAGGRTDNSGGAGTYLTTAESLGVFEDGTVEASWFDEAPQFTTPRAYFALLTTQNRNETAFPPPPEEPPCGDLDGDGFVSCDCAEPGTPPDMVDCNDADPGIHPGAAEVCGDGIDQDCDMGCTGVDAPCACMDDLDLDEHLSLDCGGDDCCDDGTETALGCTAGTAPGMHPGAIEVCDDGIDQDCDGVDPPCACMDDIDGDGHTSIACGGDDCCDTGADISQGCTDTTAPGVHPGAMEICSNGVDDDCDGFDSVCHSAPPAVHATVLPPRQVASGPAKLPPRPIYAVAGDEPVYVVAVFGDEALALTNNGGVDDFEACEVDPDTGHLACDTTWVTQNNTDVRGTFAADALLYFSYLYPFYGVNRETVSTAPSTRTFISAAIGRFGVNDPSSVTGGQVLATRQSASTSFEINRSYYKMIRLMSFVYVIGGWAEAYTDAEGTAHPEGPTGTLERHQQ